MLRKIPFIVPSAPVLKRSPPTGPEWLHEIKFDGWRAQLHKDGDTKTQGKASTPIEVATPI